MLPSVCAQPVADAANRLDRVAAERPVDLLAQVADVDVDDVGAALERDVPGAVEELRPRQRDAGAAHEQLEKGELLRGEVELVAAAPGSMGRGVEAQVADLEDGGTLDRSAPGERPKTRQELLEGERLRQVVVRSRVETADAVVDSVARRQHENRSPDAVVPQAAADLEAVRAREHDVEDDRVVRDGACHPERFLAAVGDVGGVALLAQAAAEQLAELLLVLY